MGSVRRIKMIRADEFCVDLTTTSSDLNDEEHWEKEYSKKSNQYYHVQTQDERKKIEAEKRKLRYLLFPFQNVELRLAQTAVIRTSLLQRVQCKMAPV